MATINPCSFCDANCCKSYLITATAFDVLRVMQRTGRPASDFAMLHQARILAFDPDSTLDMEDESWIYLLGFISHPCVFLEKNRCQIHECSPMACRRFPFMLDGMLNTRFCPLSSQLVFRLSCASIKAEELKRENEAHKRIVKEWNAKPGKLKDCLPFLLKRAREMLADADSGLPPMMKKKKPGSRKR